MLYHLLSNSNAQRREHRRKAGFRKSVGLFNVIDQTDNWNIEMLAAGFTKEEIKTNISGNQLHIHAQKPEASSDEYLRKEFSNHKIDRFVRLPKGINIDKIEAKLEDGILRISIPKPEQIKPQEISIN